MTCASCANRIERKLNKLDGVTATVNYATERASVDYDAAVVAPSSSSARSRRPATRRRCPSAGPRPQEPADETEPLRRRCSSRPP
jgi:Cu+-exporting ATPase